MSEIEWEEEENEFGQKCCIYGIHRQVDLPYSRSDEDSIRGEQLKQWTEGECELRGTGQSQNVMEKDKV